MGKLSLSRDQAEDEKTFRDGRPRSFRREGSETQEHGGGNGEPQDKWSAVNGKPPQETRLVEGRGGQIPCIEVDKALEGMIAKGLSECIINRLSS